MIDSVDLAKPCLESAACWGLESVMQDRKVCWNQSQTLMRRTIIQLGTALLSEKYSHHTQVSAKAFYFRLADVFWKDKTIVVVVISF